LVYKINLSNRIFLLLENLIISNSNSRRVLSFSPFIIKSTNSRLPASHFTSFLSHISTFFLPHILHPSCLTYQPSSWPSCPIHLAQNRFSLCLNLYIIPASAISSCLIFLHIFCLIYLDSSCTIYAPIFLSYTSNSCLIYIPISSLSYIQSSCLIIQLPAKHVPILPVSCIPIFPV